MLYSFSLIDLVPYLIVYIICLLNSFKKKSSLYNIAFFVVFVFSIIRYGVGYDYFNYVDNIIEYDNSSFSAMEWLSKILYFISQKTFHQLFFIVNSFICLFPIFFILKKYSPMPGLSFFTFMMIPLFFLESLSIVRYSSALSMVFIAYYFYKEKQYVKYIICCLIAGGLHSSGYIGFIFLLPLLYKSTYFFNIVIYILAIAFHTYKLDNIVYLLPGGNKVIYLRLISYLSRIEPQRGLMSIIVFFIGFINLLFWKKLISINNQNSDYLRLINLGVFFWGLFSFNVTLSLRISSYFLIFILLLVPSFIPLFKKKVAARSMIILFLSVYFASSFYVNIKGYTPSPSDRISYLPYQTVFYYKDYQNYKYRPR